MSGAKSAKSSKVAKSAEAAKSAKSSKFAQSAEAAKSAKSSKPAESVKAKSHHGSIIRSIITVVVVALITALGLCFYFNRQHIFDLISANTFSASAEIKNVESSINLTDRAKIIFYATKPVLEDQDTFNVSCNSHDTDISILGCYTAGNIHIYNISSEDLDGIIESTAAHELLHAAWDRMSANDKSKISVQIKNVYDDPLYHEQLAEDLETYDESERIEELHSRIGTEISNLPAELEEHYARYFKDQDLVVDYYDNYIAPFRELSTKIEALANRLESMNEEIESRTTKYYQAAEALSSEIDEFNSCNLRGCFTTDAEFYAKRNPLAARQNALSLEYDSLSTLIEEYNNLVEEYNDNVLRGEMLEQAINSNYQVEELNN